MELFFEQKITGKITRLVLRPKQELDSFALQMISHNEITCLAPLEAVWYDNENYLQYDITGMTPLSSRLSTVLKKSEVVRLLGSMINGFEEIDAYMLLEDNLYLNMDFVFVDGEDRLVFLYLPFAGSCEMGQIGFLQQVAERIQPDYEEKDPYLFHILNAFSRGVIKQLADLKEILRKNNVEEKPLKGADEAAPVQPKEPVQPEKKEAKQNLSGNIKIPAIEIPKPQSSDGPGSEKAQAVKIPGASFAIPGKSESFPVNVPEKKKDDKKKSDRKKEDKKAVKKKAEKVGENKKQREIRFFGKKGKVSVPGAQAADFIPPAGKEAGADRDQGMFESYVQTVIVEDVRKEKEIDPEMTLCIAEQGRKAWLIREKTGERLQIMPKATVMGSGNTADCRILGNKAISRAHAVFQIQGGICQVTDNHSSNGTWVNGIRLAPGKPVEIVNDDRIRLADEDFTLEIQ